MPIPFDSYVLVYTTTHFIVEDYKALFMFIDFINDFIKGCKVWYIGSKSCQRQN